MTPVSSGGAIHVRAADARLVAGLHSGLASSQDTAETGLCGVITNSQKFSCHLCEIVIN